MKYLQWILVVSAAVFVSVSAGAREHDCVFSPDGGRWRRECNWCICTENGVGACTRKGCPPAHLLRYDNECEGNIKWYDGCNWCYCNDGTATCTERFCAEGAGAGKDLVSKTEEDDCIYSPRGGRWRKACNWCRCTETGKGFCTRRGCPPSLALRLQNEKQCEGEAQWRNDCNWCNCVDGEARCTEKFCGNADSTNTGGRQANEECKFTSVDARWRESCNWCRCSESGASVCTRMGCPPDFELRLQNEDECKGKAEWKRGCNWCNCDKGKAVCTTSPCDEQNAGIAQENVNSDLQSPFRNEIRCEALSRDSRWRENCNWCTCSTLGYGQCTRKMCPDSSSLHKSDDEADCKGLIRWKKGCNWCDCVNGVAVCSGKSCLKDPSTSEIDEVCQTGEGGGRWRVECNWCNCHNGVGTCTLRGCNQDFNENILRDTPACEGDITWRKDCNWCRCKNGQPHCTDYLCRSNQRSLAKEETCVDGKSWVDGCNSCFCEQGKSFCTRMACIEDTNPTVLRTITREVSALALSGEFESRDCTIGSSWKDRCNWCSCPSGFAACTLMGCPPDFKPKLSEGPVCKPGSSWRQDCNYCSCADGYPVCTLMACLSKEPRTKSLQVQKQASSPLRPLECKDGSQWKNECNWCFCAGGTAGCTYKGCIPGYRDDGPQCEGDAEWRGENCSWCKCHQGSAVCEPTTDCDKEEPRTKSLQVQKQASSPLRPLECKDGSRWKNECNWCFCAGGTAGCTYKGCIPGYRDDGPQCEGDAEWRGENCSWCKCHQGSAVCEPTTDCDKEEPRTKSLQVQKQATGFSLPSPLECKDGSRWKNECNWCSCGGGRARCTYRGCRPGYRDDGPQCEGDAEWRGENCSWCKCHQGSAVCEPTTDCDREESENDCKEGNTWMEECNICSCNNNMKICTLKLCEDDFEVPEPTCTEGETWEDDCNTCRCYRGQPACTLNICEDNIEPHVVPEKCNFSPVQSSSQCTSNIEVKWSYNAQTGRCETTEDGGCGATEGLFSTREECEALCLHTRARQVPFTTPLRSRERCYLPSDSGPCLGLFTKYAFNAQKNRCEPFHYGGCQGNENNFETIQECYSACAGSPPSIDPNCDRSQCNWKRLEHYLAQNCIPIYEGGACCPTKFNCKSESEKGLEPDKCYYRGKKYNIGEDVPVEDSCSASCFCREIDNIVCANVECPSLWMRPDPGCRLLYTPGYCCSTGKECGPADSRTEEEYCTWKGQQWRIGERMDFEDEPCQDCVCTSDFTDPKGPGCTKLDCGYEFRFKRQLTQGCTPIFFEDSCCPIDWLCPDDSRIRGGNPLPSSIESGQNVCTIGQLSVPLGSTLELSECSIDCTCQTPPQLTCVKQRSCENLFVFDENEVKTQNDCPETFCPPLCSIEKDPSTRCPKCVCPNLNFICEEPSCDSSCLNPTVVFDEVAGCSVCRCDDHLCPKDFDGEPPCPQDCAVHKVFNKETGCEECVCQPNTSHPF